ncbi:MAG: hypothetical protein R2850_09165 [Bacteroidia bacterium]
MKKNYSINASKKALFTCAFSASALLLAAQPEPPVSPAMCEIYASEVISYNPQKCKDGSTISSAFTNSNNALGAPTDSDQPGPVNYASLGFGGDITLMLSAPLADSEGDDFEVVETTYNNVCARYPERAEIFVSQDGCNFVCLGQACHNGSFDLAGSGLDWIQYVKIHDISPINHHFGGQANANGYDVDGVRCLNGVVAENPVMNSEFLAGAPRTAMNFIPSHPETIAEARLNPENATGFPEGGNGSPVTFTSLGFGGEITLVFDYIVFDQEGPDLFVTETSGSSNYPEKAQFFGSACGGDWVELTTTEDGVTLEQDGWIDFNGTLYGLKYLRIVDRSRRSQFNGGADGYDVDGVVSLNQTSCTDPVDIAFKVAAVNTVLPMKLCLLTFLQIHLLHKYESICLHRRTQQLFRFGFIHWMEESFHQLRLLHLNTFLLVRCCLLISFLQVFI